MVGLNKTTCEQAECQTRPCFNYEGQRRCRFCVKHKLPGMININNSAKRPRKCEVEKCPKNAYYNLKDERLARFCPLHKQKGMVHVCSRHKWCEKEGCYAQRGFNFPGEKPRFCGKHRLEGMVDCLRRKECEQDLCSKGPAFNFPGAGSGIRAARFCSQHKFEGMVNVCERRVCQHPSCTYTRPVFNHKGQKKGKYCKFHKLEGMVSVLRPSRPKQVDKARCAHAGCRKVAHFDAKGSKKPAKKYCLQHKMDAPHEKSDDKLKLVESQMCEYAECNKPCNKRASFRFDGQVEPKLCLEHKLEGMHSILCEHEFCRKMATFNFEDESRGRLCESHKFASMVDVTKSVPGSSKLPRKTQCRYFGCTAKACYSTEGQERPVVCGQHREKGMVDVKHQMRPWKICEHEGGCSSRAYFNTPSTDIGTAANPAALLPQPWWSELGQAPTKWSDMPIPRTLCDLNAEDVNTMTYKYIRKLAKQHQLQLPHSAPVEEARAILVASIEFSRELRDAAESAAAATLAPFPPQPQFKKGRRPSKWATMSVPRTLCELSAEDVSTMPYKFMQKVAKQHQIRLTHNSLTEEVRAAILAAVESSRNLRDATESTAAANASALQPVVAPPTIDPSNEQQKASSGRQAVRENPRFCRQHRSEGMVDVINRRVRCRAGRCARHADFLYPIATQGLYCRAHRCKHQRCLKKALFNFAGERSGKFCALHRKEGMKDVVRCQQEGCIRHADFWRLTEPSGVMGRFCEHHRLDILHVNSCQHPACNRTPEFNVAGRDPIFCELHKFEDMVMVARIQRCVHPGCSKKSYRRLCKKHSKYIQLQDELLQPDLSEVKQAPKCEHTTCSKPAVVPSNVEGKTPVRFCPKHKLEDKVDGASGPPPPGASAPPTPALAPASAAAAEKASVWGRSPLPLLRVARPRMPAVPMCPPLPPAWSPDPAAAPHWEGAAARQAAPPAPARPRCPPPPGTPCLGGGAASTPAPADQRAGARDGEPGQAAAEERERSREEPPLAGRGQERGGGGGAPEPQEQAPPAHLQGEGGAPLLAGAPPPPPPGELRGPGEGPAARSPRLVRLAPKPSGPSGSGEEPAAVAQEEGAGAEAGQQGRGLPPGIWPAPGVGNDQLAGPTQSAFFSQQFLARAWQLAVQRLSLQRHQQLVVPSPAADVALWLCEQGDCTSVSVFNFEGEQRGRFCAQHKLQGMINVKSKRCVHAGCDKQPAFNFAGERRGSFCAQHKGQGMVDLRCKHKRCRKWAAFNFKGETKAEFCGKHRVEGMVKVQNDRCKHDGCSKTPHFNFEGELKGRFCAQHRIQGMVNVNKGKRCEHARCIEWPSFNLEGEQKPRFCAQHKVQGMVDVVHKKSEHDGFSGEHKALEVMQPTDVHQQRTCEHAGCRAQPILDYDGKPVARFCGQHNVKPRCEVPSCTQIPFFNHDGECRGRFCAEHKAEGMVDVRNMTEGKCEQAGCNDKATWKVKGKRPSRCKRHKLEGMVVARPPRGERCEHAGCSLMPCSNFEGETRLRFCEEHKLSGMVVGPNVKRCKYYWCSSMIKAQGDSWYTGGELFCERHRYRWAGSVSGTPLQRSVHPIIYWCRDQVPSHQQQPKGGKEPQGEASLTAGSSDHTTKLHKGSGRGPRKQEWCEHDGCGEEPGFGFESGMSNRLCEIHKLAGMVQMGFAIDKTRCEHAGCSLAASFNVKGKRRLKFCSQHKLEDMVNLRIKSKCDASGCIKEPSFNFEGKLKGRFCSQHKLEGMVNVCSERCEHAKCVKRAAYNFDSERKPRFCHQHKLVGMVDLKNKRCEHAKCHKEARYNFDSEQMSRFCEQHKLGGMVDVKNKSCEHDGCRRLSCYNFKGQRRGKFCVLHKLEGMVDVKSSTHGHVGLMTGVYDQLRLAMEDLSK